MNAKELGDAAEGYAFYTAHKHFGPTRRLLRQAFQEGAIWASSARQNPVKAKKTGKEGQPDWVEAAANEVDLLAWSIGARPSGYPLTEEVAAIIRKHAPK